MKEEIKELAKKRGLDIAEDALQNFAALSLDIVGLLVSKNKYLKMIWAGLEDDLREDVAQFIDKVDGEDDIPEKA